jgi:type II secretory pathway component PulF
MNKTPNLNTPIPLIEKGNFCRYLSTMIHSGTPILEAIDILSTQTDNKTLAGILKDIRGDLEKGKTLGAGLAKYPKAFDQVFLTVLDAGEKSGTLDKSLDYLGKQMIADFYLIQKVKGALMYPLVIIVAMIGMGFLMIGFVMPRIAKVFIASGFPLPFFTKLIFQFSLFFADYILIITPIMIGLSVVVGIYFSKGPGRELIIRALPHLHSP